MALSAKGLESFPHKLHSFGVLVNQFSYRVKVLKSSTRRLDSLPVRWRGPTQGPRGSTAYSTVQYMNGRTGRRDEGRVLSYEYIAYIEFMEYIEYREYIEYIEYSEYTEYIEYIEFK